MVPANPIHVLTQRTYLSMHTCMHTRTITHTYLMHTMFVALILCTFILQILLWLPKVQLWMPSSRLYISK